MQSNYLRSVSAVSALTVLVCAYGSSGCDCRVNVGKGAGYAPMARSGPEVWRIDGKAHRIASTYYLALPSGLQYTIAYRLSKPPAKWTFAEAMKRGLPLMRHAIREGKHRRSRISSLGGGPKKPTLVGVEFFVQRGVHRQGFRVNYPIAKLEAELNTAREKRSP